MKKIALTLFAAFCITSLVFVTACSDDDEKSCDKEALTTCVEEATQCIMDNMTDADAQIVCQEEAEACAEDAHCDASDMEQ